MSFYIAVKIKKKHRIGNFSEPFRCLVGEGGFEPPKALPADLQSARKAEIMRKNGALPSTAPSRGNEKAGAIASALAIIHPCGSPCIPGEPLLLWSVSAWFPDIPGYPRLSFSAGALSRQPYLPAARLLSFRCIRCMPLVCTPFMSYTHAITKEYYLSIPVVIFFTIPPCGAGSAAITGPAIAVKL